MEPELEPINTTFERDFTSPSREEKLRAAMALTALGYHIEHAYIAASLDTTESSAHTSKRLIQYELDTWRQLDHEGVAGPYVDFREDGEEPFIPQSGIAYWIKHQ